MKFDCKTSSTLAKLKRKFLGAPTHDQPQTEDSRHHLEGGTIDLASRNHLEGGTIDLAPWNLSGELPLGRPEHILRMLKSYNPPDIPSVPSLNNELIERCSKPFEKQLSASDLKDSQQIDDKQIRCRKSPLSFAEWRRESLENGEHFITSMICRAIRISLLSGCFEDVILGHFASWSSGEDCPFFNQSTGKDWGIIDQMLIVFGNTPPDFIHDNVQLATFLITTISSDWIVVGGDYNPIQCMINWNDAVHLD